MFFVHKSNNRVGKKLPKPISEYMILKFNVSSEYLEMLRCFEYNGLFKGKQVMYVNIFDPDMALERRVLIRNSLDLENHPEILLYKGHIDNEGKVYVADRRVPATSVRAP